MTDITSLQTYTDFKAADTARSQGLRAINLKEREIEQATEAWKQKEQALQKAINSQTSTHTQIETLETEAADLKALIPPLSDELTALRSNQSTLQQDWQTTGNAFVNEAAPLVTADIDEAETRLDEALDLLLQIHANEQAAASTPFKNIPVIHPAIDYARLSQQHVTQSREKFDRTHS